MNVIEVTWRMVDCPKCHAEPGQKCPIPGNPHIERIRAAAREFRSRNAPAIAELGEQHRMKLLLAHGE